MAKAVGVMEALNPSSRLLFPIEAFSLWPCTVNNGKMEVPSILLEPITVDRNNLDQTVIKDGYQKREDVYKNVPGK